MPDGVDNTITYTYDGRGNRTKRIVTGLDAGTTVYIYNSNNRLTLETTTDYKGTSITAYEYDKNGNNTAKVCGTERLEYRYDAFGKLKRYITNDDIARYAYNSSGIRTLKSVDGVETKYILNGGDVIGEVSGGMTTTYLRGINLICTDEYYYVFDAHGDVVNLTDEDGNTVKSYIYDAFGVEKNRDDSDSNPFRYCGEYWDSETETYYLRARNYDPNLGRFSSEDSYGVNIANPLSLNLYTYCWNNPVLLIDSTGYWPSWSQIGAALAITAVAVVSVAAVVATAGAAGAAGAAVGTGLALYFGASASTALTLTSVATAGAYGVAAAMALTAASDVGEVLTGHNVIRDDLFGGNQGAYDDIKLISWMIGAGIIQTGADYNTYIGTKSKAEAYNGERHPEKDFYEGNLLDKHFDRHAKDFNITSKDVYVQKAEEFLTKKPTSTTYSFYSADGWYFRYDSATNEFGIMNDVGGISTYFKPVDKLAYWYLQVDKYCK